MIASSKVVRSGGNWPMPRRLQLTIRLGLPLALSLGMLGTLGLLPTRVSGQPEGKKKAAPVPVRTTVLATGLWHPWSLAFLPNGDMLITERNGKLRVRSEEHTSELQSRENLVC